MRLHIEEHGGIGYQSSQDASSASDGESRMPERELILRHFNNTSTPYPIDKSVHGLFEEQVERKPGSIALIWGARRFTYDELNRKANQLAHALLGCGVRPDDRVGLFAERSAETVVGMLAILKAGAAYVPLDPNYPAERLQYMQRDSGIAAVLTTSMLCSRLTDADRTILLLDGDALQPDGNPVIAGHSSSNLAYVIYTSGSTGEPKGVMVEHRNIISLVVNNHYAPLGADDCVAHCASPSFDATTWEVWSALLNGGCLAIIPQCVVLDPVALNRELLEHSVTAMWLTVGLFNEYVDALEDAFGALRYLLVGGDALTPSVIARALAKQRPPKHIINGYGPTETTTFAATFDIKFVEESAKSIPIGRPIGNARIYILDEQGEPAPIGVTGEIHIGGSGVSRGYLNRRELTEERFVIDPFSDMPNDRLYRSGDLGRWRPDGTVEYLGRNDLQVKIRGFRVELGEVEAVLRDHPGVRQAVAVAREEGSGGKRLIGYVVPEEDWSNREDEYDARISRLLEALREYLKGKLPPHMVPATLVPLESIPLTANGKVDRRALPSPEGRQYLPRGYIGAATATEQELAALWKQALKVQQVGVQDNFFELGGDSLLGIEVIGRIADTFDVELPFMAVFQYPTIRQLAEFVDGARSEKSTPVSDSASAA
jgi:amino acid adenylation domain-containing protein